MDRQIFSSKRTCVQRDSFGNRNDVFTCPAASFVQKSHNDNGRACTRALLAVAVNVLAPWRQRIRWSWSRIYPDMCWAVRFPADTGWWGYPANRWRPLVGPWDMNESWNLRSELRDQTAQLAQLTVRPCEAQQQWDTGYRPDKSFDLCFSLLGPMSCLKRKLIGFQFKKKIFNFYWFPFFVFCIIQHY